VEVIQEQGLLKEEDIQEQLFLKEEDIQEQVLLKEEGIQDQLLLMEEDIQDQVHLQELTFLKDPPTKTHHSPQLVNIHLIVPTLLLPQV